jgi:hypothetical protein
VHSDLWDTAAAISGVTVVCDPAGTEARRFEAATSGHTAVYDAAGDRVFSGGITGARGQVGENLGGEAVVAWICHGWSGTDQTAVYGCPLLSP